jgi:hypothetical protein
MLNIKACAKCGTSRPLADFGKDANRKDGFQPYCKACNRQYRLANKDRISAYREQNREYYRAKNQEWRALNPDLVAQRNAAQYYANRDESIRRVRDWQRANPDKHCEIQVRRYASVKSSQPAWADRLAIAAVYKTAAQIRRSGFDVHVDHIVPLRSKIVCGLHVQHNLQIIDRRINLIKNNRQWPDMP